MSLAFSDSSSGITGDRYWLTGEMRIRSGILLEGDRMASFTDILHQARAPFRKNQEICCTRGDRLSGVGDGDGDRLMPSEHIGIDTQNLTCTTYSFCVNMFS